MCLLVIPWFLGERLRLVVAFGSLLDWLENMWLGAFV